MLITQHIAKHLRDVHFGGNWTAVNLKDLTDDVDWHMATQQVESFHTIAELVFHMNYFVDATLQVFREGKLEAKDKFSFDLPSVRCQADWDQLLEKSWRGVEELASLIEEMPEDKIWDVFVDEKYGTYYRCLQGLVEHCHYHLGQIAMLKSMVQS